MAHGLLVPAALMIRCLPVLVVIALTGCLPSAEEAFAPHAEFGTQIDMCRDQNACVPLCVRVFDVGIQDIAGCRITRMQPDGAWVRVDYYSDDSGFGFDFDDGGSGDDYEPPPDDYPDEDSEPDDDPEPDDDDGYDGDEEP